MPVGSCFWPVYFNGFDPNPVVVVFTLATPYGVYVYDAVATPVAFVMFATEPSASVPCVSALGETSWF